MHPSIMKTPLFVLLAAISFGAITVPAQQPKKEAPKSTKPAPQPAPKARKGTKWDAMDIGSFFSSGLEATVAGQKIRPALKALSISLGDQGEATLSFDTERLRMAAGWTGGFMQLATGREGLEGVPSPAGEVAFGSTLQAGWADAKGNFTEPQPPIIGGNAVSFGPLPKEWAKWRGFYQNGKQVILSYTVGSAAVLELPGFDSANKIFTRTFQITGGAAPLTMFVLEDTKAKARVENGLVILETGDRLIAVGTAGTKGSFEIAAGNKVLLKLAGPANGHLKVSIWAGPTAEFAKVKSAMLPPAGKTVFPDLAKLTQGGPRNWGDALTVKGVLGTEEGPYQVDTITQPDLDANPWKSWIRSSGFDFFKDGTTAALCSVSGDVWVVSGIDATLENVKWKRFATGMFQPLGLKVVDEKIYVLGRDQITRLHDLNSDGEADFYENFNNDVAISNQYHEFNLNLDTDPDGNFYFTKGGDLGPWKHQHHGCLLRVSKDGSRLDVVATGLRAPNGMGVGPKGELTTADNEGNWVPSSRVDLTKQGGFLGHIHTARGPRLAVQGTNVIHYVDAKEVAKFSIDSDNFKTLSKTIPVDYDKPIVWLPHTYEMDNSSGGQVWVTSDKWGPFAGDLLHLSYGACAMHKISHEFVDGQVQGAAIKFPLKFESGIMRGRFNAKDGQLYLCGLVVWQSKGPKTGAFHRVRYTGQPVRMPEEVRVRPNGIEITFTAPLDAALAQDLQSYSLEQWNYRWTSSYGSKDYKPSAPEQLGRDKVEIKSAKLSADKRTVFLETGPVRPVMQSLIKVDLKTADGAPIKYDVYHTINQVPSK